MAEFQEFTRKMEKTLEVLGSQFASVRAGRANAQVLDRITVSYYGQDTPIGQVASISSPDPRTLVIQPWDSSLLKPIEKAIQLSDLGINPQNDGRIVRLVFPQLTEERRKDLTKQVKKYAEDARWPSATSAATAWTPSRSSSKRARSPRTTRRRARKISRSLPTSISRRLTSSAPRKKRN